MTKYLTKRIIHPDTKLHVIEMYKQGMSAQEIKDALVLQQSTRQIQRWINQAGMSRTVGDAYRNAIARNRVKWKFVEIKRKYPPVSPKLRYQVLERDKFTCVKCGGHDMLEIDHIDENKNHSVLTNLQTLCYLCALGKTYNHLS